MTGNASDSRIAIDHPIIFFDGVCGMCNRFVNVIQRADKSGVFRFAPLQGETSRRMLGPLPDDPTAWSLIYIDECGKHELLDASIQIYRRLGGVWTLLSLARFAPRFLRDPAYRFVARNRYSWFGRSDTCRVPTAVEKARFLA